MPMKETVTFDELDKFELKDEPLWRRAIEVNGGAGTELAS